MFFRTKKRTHFLVVWVFTLLGTSSLCIGCSDAVPPQVLGGAGDGGNSSGGGQDGGVSTSADGG